MDLLIYGIVLLLFAVFVTVHAALCIQLGRKVWWRGLVGFFVFPLAPYWAQAERIRKLPAVWVASASIYALALFVGLI